MFQWPAAIRWRWRRRPGPSGDGGAQQGCRGARAKGRRLRREGGTLTAPLYLSFVGRPLLGQAGPQPVGRLIPKPS